MAAFRGIEQVFLVGTLYELGEGMEFPEDVVQLARSVSAVRPRSLFFCAGGTLFTTACTKSCGKKKET